ncbi:hypothetical protein F5Y19DRAFT_479749 [Xylariaceae sp. FL1651]|nr:hypothetical protein F5Y19DRAFT_479749 [Xylariaceae sp. FL1651]
MDFDGYSKRRLATAIVSSVAVISFIFLRFWRLVYLPKIGGCSPYYQHILEQQQQIYGVSSSFYDDSTGLMSVGLFKGSTNKELVEVIALLQSSPTLEHVAALENYLKGLYIDYFLSVFILTCIRLSICCLYRYIFTSQKFRSRSTMVIGISVAWFIAAFIVSFAICVLLDVYWSRSKPGHCLNFNIYFLLIGVFETLIDVAILALPLAAIFKIQLPLKTRFFVSSIFLLGGFAVVTNVLRIYHAYQPNSTHEFSTFHSVAKRPPASSGAKRHDATTPTPLVAIIVGKLDSGYGTASILDAIIFK